MTGRSRRHPGLGGGGFVRADLRWLLGGSDSVRPKLSDAIDDCEPPPQIARLRSRLLLHRRDGLGARQEDRIANRAREVFVARKIRQPPVAGAPLAVHVSVHFKDSESVPGVRYEEALDLDLAPTRLMNRRRTHVVPRSRPARKCETTETSRASLSTRRRPAPGVRRLARTAPVVARMPSRRCRAATSGTPHSAATATNFPVGVFPEWSEGSPPSPTHMPLRALVARPDESDIFERLR